MLVVCKDDKCLGCAVVRSYGIPTGILSGHSGFVSTRRLDLDITIPLLQFIIPRSSNYTL